MKQQRFIIVLAAACLTVLAACTPNQAVQVNTPVPSTGPGTPAPGGEIDVPGVKVNLYVPGPNPLAGTPDANGRPASFWLGVWHGVISPFTLVASFIGSQGAQTYEVHNDGRLYNLGFFIGILVMPAVLGIIFGWWR
jgi:hypothetical protein